MLAVVPQPPNNFGRAVITTDVEEITKDNVCAVLQKAMTTHSQNSSRIDWLYQYYKGDQPVLKRVKEGRPEINNPVVANIAYELVEFKTGYLIYEPVQYVSSADDKGVTEKVEELNRYMSIQDKEAQDTFLAWWFHICGTAYRMVLPNKLKQKGDKQAPFEIYTLDPRYTFVVRRNDLGKTPIMSVQYVTKEDGKMIFSIYTKDRYFEVSNQISVIKEEGNPLGGIPVIEYPANIARLGCFEIVLSLMDAINEIESNRTDAVQQFVQALLLFHNTDITSEDFAKLREQGALKFKDIDPSMRAEIQYLVEELNQDQTQTVVDNMYQRILNICGMPNRSGGSGRSTSDTGKAVVYRDGWGAAEYRAKLTERCFRSSEKEFLELVLKICRDLSDIDLQLNQFDIRMPRRNYDNVKEKADTLVMMLNNDKIAPKLAFEHCGMFIDPETAYISSKKYAEEVMAQTIANMKQIAGVQNDSATGVSRGTGRSSPIYSSAGSEGSSVVKRKGKKSGMIDRDGDGIVGEQ